MGVYDEKTLEKIVCDYHIGGFVFYQGSAQNQAAITNRLQAASKYPLLIAQDSEWGLGMRLNDALQFPQNMTLAEIEDESLLYKLGKEIGGQCRAIGVHLNFAPVVDINSNPDNPIIGIRSFGLCRQAVARKGRLIAKGLQDGGVIACMKHFPGHGDTNVDSHKDIPGIFHSLERLQEEELYPFKVLIDAGIGGVMMGHLSVPALDTSCFPASLSRPIVTDLLRKKLGFDGLVLTDGMVMKAISQFFGPEEAALMAIQAGNDIVVGPLDIKKSITYLVQAAKDGQLDLDELDAHVLKILRAKEKLALHKKYLVDLDVIHESLHSKQAQALKKTLYKHAIRVVRNEKNVIPLTDIDTSRVGVFDVTHRRLPSLSKMKAYETIVLRIFSLGKNQGPYGKNSNVSARVQKFFKSLQHLDKKVVIVLCMSPYALDSVPDVPTIIAHEDDPNAVEAAMYVLWGERWAEQTLQTMTLEEKIGQLFMVGVVSDQSEDPERDYMWGHYVDEKRIELLIRDYQIGGLIFFRGTAQKQAAMTNRLQTISKYPLLVGQDSEWGLGMRLRDALSYPKNETLGVIEDDSLLYEFGKEVGRQCRAIGVHVNFAPVVDINSNPDNPIIGARSIWVVQRKRCT